MTDMILYMQDIHSIVALFLKKKFKGNCQRYI